MEDTIFLEKKKVLTNRTIFIKAKGKLFTDVTILHNYFEEDQSPEKRPREAFTHMDFPPPKARADATPDSAGALAAGSPPAGGGTPG